LVELAAGAVFVAKDEDKVLIAGERTLGRGAFNLEADGAAHLPGCVHNAGDECGFGGVAWAEGFVQVAGEFFEAAFGSQLLTGGEEEVLGVETVSDGVAGGAALALGRFGSG
jgi:hypothetical protein